MTALFTGCTCGGNPPPPPPAPTATAPPALSATPAARDTDTPAAPPDTFTPAPAATPNAAAIERQTACESYVAVLSGRKQNDAILAMDEVRELGQAHADLVMCGAVFSDSDKLCTALFPVESGPGPACRRMWSIFHELRTNPNGRTFMLDEVDWESFQTVPMMKPFADGLRAALRSGQAADCAKAGDGESICRAYLALDKQLCVVTGALAEAEIKPPHRKEGEPATVKLKAVLEEACRQTIDSRAFLAKGLQSIATSGPERERELAKAALGQEEACAALAKAAADVCTAGGAGSGGGAPPAATPVAAAAAATPS